MATVPLKSQPLHNFPLPLLKWGNKNHMNNGHRLRRPSDSAGSDSPPPPAVPPSTTTDNHCSLDHDLEAENTNKPPFGSRAARNRFSLSPCSLQKQKVAVLERGGEDGGAEKACDEGEGDQSAVKPWNLRPRRIAMEIATASKNALSGELRETSPAAPTIPVNENLPKSLRLRGFMEGHGLQRKEKKRFWIALSREEIEEDIYSLTGSKPSRKPKKRSKAVQKLVDNVFPGLYLVGASADSYRVDYIPLDTVANIENRMHDIRFKDDMMTKQKLEFGELIRL